MVYRSLMVVKTWLKETQEIFLLLRKKTIPSSMCTYQCKNNFQCYIFMERKIFVKSMKITAVNKWAITVINYINFILSIMKQSIMKCEVSRSISAKFQWNALQMIRRAKPHCRGCYYSGSPNHGIWLNVYLNINVID